MRPLPAQMRAERLARPLWRALPAQHRSNVLDRNVRLLDQDRKTARLTRRLLPGFGEPLFIFARGWGGLLGFLAANLFDPPLLGNVNGDLPSRLFCRHHADAPLRIGNTAPVAAGGEQQYVAHCSMSLRRLLNRSVRR